MTPRERSDRMAEWEGIARRVLLDPHASHSEVSVALVGITRSKNPLLRRALEKKKTTAWKADINVIKKLPH